MATSVTTRRALLGGLGVAALPLLTRAPAAQAATGPEVLTAPSSSEDNVVRAQSAAVLPLTVRASAEQTEPLTTWRDGTGVAAAAIDESGNISQPRTRAGHAPFGWRLAGSTFNGLWDPSVSLGYNLGNKTEQAMGKPTVVGEPYAGYFIESDYDDGMKRTVEQYWEMRASNGTLNVRPWMYQVSRFATDPESFITGAQIIGNPLTISVIRNGAGNPVQPTVDVAEFHAHNMIFRAPLTDRPNMVSINGGANQRSWFRFGANEIPYQWQLVADRTRFDLLYGYTGSSRFYGMPRGVAGAAFAVGADDTSAAGVFDTAPSANSMKGLVVRGKGAMTVNLMELQDAERNVLSGYDKNGTWFTNRTTPPTDAEVKIGQMAIWFDAVGGRFRFKSRDAKDKIRLGSVSLTASAA